MKIQELPPHLQKYVVEQEDRVYTPIDHAVWRFCLRQLKDFLSRNAHSSYLEGLAKTGIEVERIPKISAISDKLSEFGWRALPVSGFIPPAAFMELQALNVLPIASDVRSMDHVTYTPAPDIVHEAAGHAPMLGEPAFAQYLRNYAQVAKKAIISRDDMNVYEAIRDLSDLKESHESTPEQISAAEKRLVDVTNSVKGVSEATWLSRMNWWTAEYGLFGPLAKPKILGAGLLSSVAESRLCLSDKVQKLPLSIECIDRTYDITEPQPQLYVTPDFDTLTTVLNQLADRMGFRVGGLASVRKAIEADTVNTIELDSGLQISGHCIEAITAGASASEQLAYLRFDGPCQLSVGGNQLPGHGKEYHAHGFGTAVGSLAGHPGRSPADLTDAEWEKLGARAGGEVRLEYASGVVVTGRFKDRVRAGGRSVVLALENARAGFQGRVLFDPSWGTFDLALGASVPSVYGGPADREAFGNMDDFKATRIPTPKYSEKERRRHEGFARLRQWREANRSDDKLAGDLENLLRTHMTEFPSDWLLALEAYELSLARALPAASQTFFRGELDAFARREPTKADVIRDGLNLAAQL